jgi:hypothetical protein
VQTMSLASEVSAHATARLDAIIEAPDIWISAPASSCAVAGVAALVAWSVGLPAGIEYLPGCSTRQPLAPAERVTLTGLTAREALDRLVKIDPRYHWTETNGVVVIRPLKAWDDRSHFLHRIVSSFHIDAKNYAAALHAVQVALGGPTIANPDDLGRRTAHGSAPISVHLDTATSAYEALNAIVRAHGALRWRVTYCTEEARHEFATIWMDTYDGSGLGTHPAVLKDANGKRYDPCRSRR